MARELAPPLTQERRSRSRLCRKSAKLVEAQPRRQGLPLDTSSRFTRKGPGQRAPPNSETALSLVTLSKFNQVGGGPATTTRAPARYFLTIYSKRLWPESPPDLRNGALARDFVAIQPSWWRPSHDDKGSLSILLDDLLLEALARAPPPELRNGALARDFLVIQPSWWRPSHDDKGSRSTLSHDFLQNALAREPPPPPPRSQERRSRSRLPRDSISSRQ